MKQEFQDNVTALLSTIVNEKAHTPHTAHDILDILLLRLTLPISHRWEDGRLHLVYYNVSITLHDDLSSLHASYNSDLSATLSSLQQSDPHQLADFILALERDIPQWKHLWDSIEKKERMRRKLGNRISTLMQNLRHHLVDERNPSRLALIEEPSRRLFYNVKAMQLMLEHDNPYWENKQTDEEIIQQFLPFHITPPFEQWYDEWTSFLAQCRARRNEIDRKREERETMIKKIQHISRIKTLMANALISTVEWHPGVEAHTRAASFLPKPSLRDQCITVKLTFDEASIVTDLNLQNFDQDIQKVLHCYSRINDLYPELCQSLEEDSKREGHRFHIYTYKDIDTTIPNNIDYGCEISIFYEGERRKGTIYRYEDDSLPSCRLVGKMNAILNELVTYFIEKYRPGADTSKVR